MPAVIPNKESGALKVMSSNIRSALTRPSQSTPISGVEDRGIDEGAGVQGCIRAAPDQRSIQERVAADEGYAPDAAGHRAWKRRTRCPFISLPDLFIH